MFVTYIQKITFIYNIKKNEVNYAELKKWLITKQPYSRTAED